MTPGTDLLQFVDSIASSPTVVLNLNSGAPWYIAGNGWSAPPPRLDRASLRSTARDGTNIAQSSYGDRELVVTLGLDVTSQDAAATAIQALGRLLNAGGQWLKWQPSTTAPVFFRTKRAEFDGIAEFNGQKDGFREITIRIPAEPFAYGLPVTGSATINNDPTHATNPMSFAFPAIQGDVATPLYLDLTQSNCQRTVVTTTAVPASSWPAVPFYVDSTTMTTNSAGTPPWTVLSDALMVGGSAWRLSTSASGYAGFVEIVGGLTSLPRGEYRVFSRMRGSAAGSWTFEGLTPYGLAPRTYTTHSSGGTPMVEWFEIGLARLPAQAPLADATFGIATPTGGVDWRMLITANQATASTLDVDGWLFVPVGPDVAHLQTYAEVGIRNNGTHLVIDGINARVYGIRSTGFVGSDSPLVLAGDFPHVVPGASNILHLLRDTWLPDSSPSPAGGAKSSTSPLSYTYFPRYLYDRPATT